MSEVLKPHSEHLAAFKAWALATTRPITSEWCITRAEARSLFEQLEASQRTLEAMFQYLPGMLVRVIDRQHTAWLDGKKPDLESTQRELEAELRALGSNPASSPICKCGHPKTAPTETVSEADFTRAGWKCGCGWWNWLDA